MSHFSISSSIDASGALTVGFDPSLIPAIYYMLANDPTVSSCTFTPNLTGYQGSYTLTGIHVEGIGSNADASTGLFYGTETLKFKLIAPNS